MKCKEKITYNRGGSALLTALIIFMIVFYFIVFSIDGSVFAEEILEDDDEVIEKSEHIDQQVDNIDRVISALDILIKIISIYRFLFWFLCVYFGYI